MSTPADGELRVERQPDGRWRWSWTPGEGPPLLSNESFEAAEEAHGAAREAYPGAVLVEDAAAAAEAPGARRRRTALALLVALVVGFAAGRRSRVLRPVLGTDARAGKSGLSAR